MRRSFAGGVASIPIGIFGEASVPVIDTWHPDFGGIDLTGVADARAALADADAAGVPKRLRPGTHRVATSLSLTGSYQFSRGAVLKPDAGATVTFTAVVEAGAYQIFDESAGGDIVFANGQKVRAEWWGAQIGNVVDSTAAWVAATTCGASVAKGKGGTYRLTDKVTPAEGVTVQGNGRRSTLFHQEDATKAVFVLDEDFVTLKDIGVTHESDAWDVGTSAIQGSGTDINIEGVLVRDVERQAVNPANGARWRVSDCDFYRIGRGGVVMNFCPDSIVEGCRFDETGDDAIAINGTSNNCIVAINVIRRAGTLLGQGSGIKSHGVGSIIIGNTIKDSVSGGIWVKMVNTGVLGTDGPADTVIASNVIDRFGSDIVGTQAGIHLNEAQGVVHITDNIVKAYTTTKNVFAFHGEFCANADVRLKGNSWIHNPALTAANLVDFQSTVKTFSSVDDFLVCAAGDSAYRFQPSVTGGDVYIERPKCYSAVTGNWLSLTTAGLNRLEVVGARCPNLTGAGNFLFMSGVAITTLVTRDNVRGSASEASGTGGIVSWLRNPSKSIRTGSVTISNTNTTAAQPLGGEADASYKLYLTQEPSASAVVGTAYVSPGTKLSSGFTVALSVAPGSGNSVVVNWMLTRE